MLSNVLYINRVLDPTWATTGEEKTHFNQFNQFLLNKHKGCKKQERRHDVNKRGLYSGSVQVSVELFDLVPVHRSRSLHLITEFGEPLRQFILWTRDERKTGISEESERKIKVLRSDSMLHVCFFTKMFSKSMNTCSAEATLVPTDPVCPWGSSMFRSSLSKKGQKQHLKMCCWFLESYTQDKIRVQKLLLF